MRRRIMLGRGQRKHKNGENGRQAGDEVGQEEEAMEDGLTMLEGLPCLGRLWAGQRDQF